MADQDSPRPPDRSRRAVIFATVGIVVIMGLAVFYVAVVAPLRETHAVVRGFTARHWFGEAAEDAVARLGGPERAAGRLATYLRLPRWMRTDRDAAVVLLGRIGPDAKCAVPALVKALGYSDAHVCMWATQALGRIGPAAKDAAPALERLRDDPNEEQHIRNAAAAALKKIRGEGEQE